MLEIRAATVDDAGRVFELLDARSHAAFGRSEVSRPLVEAELHRSIDDRFVAEDGGRLVGYAHVRPTHDVVVATGDAATADHLLSRVEDRARERDIDVIEATVAAQDAPFHRLVGRAGFTHDRDILRMWRVLDGSLRSPQWPGAVTVRTYEDGDAAPVKSLLDTAYSWDVSYTPQSLDEWLAYMTDHDEFDPSLWFLVERDYELVGCALHWKEERRRGWLKDVAVAEHARGAGLGTSLVRHGLLAYAQRDVERVGLKVDAANPTGAAALYEREGFVTDQRLEIWQKRL
ncbi:MAG TPA: GNAT family N-acetyltransferase [Gaiellaceae bacterium]|nr:GNAT family N-acetyltransferase [Gaiellaceae bacterium]